MPSITTVTQKGQITLPIDIRKYLDVQSYDKVMISIKNSQVVVEPVKDILDFAGSILAIKGKSVLKAREAFEKNYKRV